MIFDKCQFGDVKPITYIFFWIGFMIILYPVYIPFSKFKWIEKLILKIDKDVNEKIDNKEAIEKADEVDRKERQEKEEKLEKKEQNERKKEKSKINIVGVAKSVPVENGSEAQKLLENSDSTIKNLDNNRYKGNDSTIAIIQNPREGAYIEIEESENENEQLCNTKPSVRVKFGKINVIGISQLRDLKTKIHDPHAKNPGKNDGSNAAKENIFSFKYSAPKEQTASKGKTALDDKTAYDVQTYVNAWKHFKADYRRLNPISKAKGYVEFEDMLKSR